MSFDQNVVSEIAVNTGESDKSLSAFGVVESARAINGCIRFSVDGLRVAFVPAHVLSAPAVLRPAGHPKTT